MVFQYISVVVCYYEKQRWTDNGEWQFLAVLSVLRESTEAYLTPEFICWF